MPNLLTFGTIFFNHFSSVHDKKYNHLIIMELSVKKLG